MEQTLKRSSTPTHVWIVGVITLLWNSFGSYDYVMTKLDPEAYLASMGITGAGADYMISLPAWFTVSWALGVWGSLAGSVLLLARSRHAVTAFAISLAGFLFSHVVQVVQPPPADLQTTAMWVMTGIIAVTLILQLLYCRRQAANGVLG